MKRRGFTLVEVVLATSIFSLMAVALFSAFIGGQRLLKLTLARSELSLRSRELRDKLLFHAAPSSGETTWAGLLSATNGTGSPIQLNGSKILLYASGVKGKSAYGGTSVPQTIDLTQTKDGDSASYLKSSEPKGQNGMTRWLQPGKLDFFGGNDTSSPVFDATPLEEDKRFYVNVRGRIEVGGITVAHDERIVVPLFGSTQSTEDDEGGGLCQ